MINHNTRPILTISIPTFNRAQFLRENLEQLSRIGKNRWNEIELIVSNNCSTDDTEEVVMNAIKSGLPIKYQKNSHNIGSDLNIAQSFNLANGKYVLILGDDDFLIDSALEILVKYLNEANFGVICIKSFGFNNDFMKEYPKWRGKVSIYDDPGQFLIKINSMMTLISSCVINKSIIGPCDAKDYIGGNLVQVHLVLKAALSGLKNLHLNQYLIGCKRNNSGGYDFSKVFVTNLGDIFDQYKSSGLSEKAIYSIENKMLLSYFPFYILKSRTNLSFDNKASLLHFSNRFGNRLLFKYWIKPLLILPRPIALIWGIIITFIGRVLGGDLPRGLYFLFNKIKSRFNL